MIGLDICKIKKSKTEQIWKELEGGVESSGIELLQ